MKYAIVKVTNGNYSIHAEGYTDKNAAKVVYHQVCSALWNAEDVQTACIKIVDENLDAVDGYTELINKTEPEPITIVSILNDGDTYTVTFSDGSVMTHKAGEQLNS